MVQRITYRRTCSYNTRSNKIRKVRTPGGRTVAHHISKRAGAPSHKLGKSLGGVPSLRPTAYAGLSRRQKTVSRPYGGVLTGTELKERIIRAFLIEEVKIVKRVMKSKKDKPEGKKKSKK